jgi:shikimate dehydrogenase
MNSSTSFITKDTVLYVSLAERPGNTGTLWFNKMFTEKNIDAIYKAFQVDRGDFEKAFDGIKSLKVGGGAISMPFKKKAYEMVDEVQGVGKKIGTINTFRRESSGKLTGFNTDYVAALNAIPKKANSVALLGAGGVAAAVALAAQDREVSNLRVFSRERTRSFIPLSVNYEWLSWERLNQVEASETVINCTSLGMAPSFELTLPESWWSRMKLAVDLTFRPEGNFFCRTARERRISFIDGKQMARWQALEQFKIYTGIEISETESGY